MYPHKENHLIKIYDRKPIVHKIFHFVLALGILLQGIGPVWAQPLGPIGEAPSDWTDNGVRAVPTEFVPQDPPLQLPAHASNIAELIPSDFAVITATVETTATQTAVISTTGTAVSLFNNQVLLVLDTNTFTTAVQFRATLSNTLPVTPTQPALGAEQENKSVTIQTPLPDSPQLQLSFIDPTTGQPAPQPVKPVHIVFDLRATSGTNWYIALQDPYDSTSWYYPIFITHDENGLISTSFDWLPPVIKAGAQGNGAGLNPESDPSGEPQPWRYQWTLPTVSTFSGAATYQYPIELPPGRAGLTPNIDFSYSSRGVDGLVALAGYDQNTLGLGWSMNAIEISRSGVNIQYYFPYNMYRVYHNGTFSLVLNGSSHRLERVSGEASGNDYITTYYAVNAPQLRIQQIYDADATGINTDRLYWVVQSSNGTTYRLGYTPDSETGQSVNNGHSITLTGPTQHAGYSTQYSGMRWRVDTITDVYGNQVQYDYYEKTLSVETYDNPNAVDTIVTSTTAIISQIRYNYQNLASSPTTRVTTGSYATRIDFVRWVTDIWEHMVVDDIKIYHLDFSRPYRVINLEPGVSSNGNPPGCHGDDPYVSAVIIDSIRQEYTDANNNFYALPYTEFSYALKTHGEGIDGDCFRFPHLEQVTNGYGGQVKFVYTDGDGRYDPDATNGSNEEPPTPPIPPRYGQSYPVLQMQVSDGIHRDANNNLQWATTDYTFQNPCYDDQGDGNLGTLPGATYCFSQPGIDTYIFPQHGPLTGFQQATVIAKDYDGTTLNKQITQFWRGTGVGDDTLIKLGQPIYTEQYDATNFRTARQDFTYTPDYAANQFDFLYNSSTLTTRYMPGGQTETSTTISVYGRQDGVQYGNLTCREERDTNNNILRITTTSYYPNTTKWIVGLPANQAVYAAGSCAAPTSLVADTRNYYDDQGSWAISPGNTGKLTRVSRLKDTGNPTYQTVQKMQYSAYGNVTGVTDGLTLSTYTTTAYDSTYNLYPISITNELGHVQLLYYYDLNAAFSPVVDDENNPGLPGLLAQTTDPNGLSVHYVYDHFGRLSRVFQGWAEQGSNFNYPSEAHMYFDYGSNRLNTGPFMIATWRKHADDADLFSNGGLWERQFYDGLGNLVQTQRPHTDWASNNGIGIGQEIVTDTSYNAAGKAISQSVPYFRAAYSYSTVIIGGVTYIVTPYQTPGSQARITTQYDSVGQAVRTVALDGGVTSAVYGIRSLYNQDANNHLKASYLDAMGNLAAVDELYANYEDTFSNASLPGWNKTTGVVGDGSIAKLTGDGGNNWSTYMWRSLAAVGNDSAIFSFRVNNANIQAVTAVQAGISGQANYRRWGLLIEGGQIKWEQYEGTSITNEPLMSVTANTWYRAYLRTSGSADQEFVAVVWQADNPAIRAEYRLQKTDSSWFGSTWNYTAQVETNAMRLDIDNYQDIAPTRTTYQYDTLGNLTTVVSPPAGSTTYTTAMTYNALGQKITMSDPDMGNWSYSYDAAGNLQTQTDANGTIIYFVYDDLSRLTHKRTTNVGTAACTTSNPCLATYEYDSITGGNKGIGRRTGMIAYQTATNSATWKYDTLGQVIQETRKVTTGTIIREYTFQFTYSQGGLPVTLTYPGNDSGGLGGETVTTGYWWATGQAKSLSGYHEYVTEALYDHPTGQITELTSPTSDNDMDIITDYDYNTNFQLSKIKVFPSRGASASGLFWMDYTYDKVGNITQMVDHTIVSNNTQTQQFVYDSLNRLALACTLSGAICSTDSASGRYKETYWLDYFGNIMEYDGIDMGYGQSAMGVLPGARPHLVTHWNNEDNPRYVYDANGNMTSRKDMDGTTWTQVWTPENMLLSATAGSDSVSLVYDGDNQTIRRREQQGSVINTTVLLGKLIEHNISTGAYKKYYLFNGKLLALREGLSSISTYRYLVTDHLGSLNTTLNLDGTVYSDLRYTPFGKERWAINTSPTGARFTAQRLDDLLTLYNYNARYYDPAIGRFISADTLIPGVKHTSLIVDFAQFIPAGNGFGPSNPQNLNRYTYTRNNPTNHIDPTGHETASMSLNLEEAQNLADALDVIQQIIQSQGDKWTMEALLTTIAETLGFSGLAGLLDHFGAASIGSFTTEFSAMAASGASAEGLFAFGAASAGFLIAIGIGIGLLVGGFLVGGIGVSWTQAADEIGFFKSSLQEVIDKSSNEAFVYIGVINNVLNDDIINVRSYDGIQTVTAETYPKHVNGLNAAGDFLIFIMRTLADNGVSPVYFSYFYGSYLYYGNDNWQKLN